jgi:hypothetical protein
LGLFLQLVFKFAAANHRNKQEHTKKARSHLGASVRMGQDEGKEGRCRLVYNFIVATPPAFSLSSRHFHDDILNLGRWTFWFAEPRASTMVVICSTKSSIARHLLRPSFVVCKG